MDDAVAEPSRQRRVADELVVVALVALACVLAAVVVGLIWAWVAPPVKYGIDAQYRLALFDAEPEQAMASDVWYAALTAALGLAAAVGVALRAPRRPGGSVGGLLLGTSLAAFVVLGVGALLRPGDLGAAVTAQPQAVLEDALVLRAQGFLVAGPIAAMVAWTALDLLRSALGREPRPSADEPLAPPDPGARADPAPDLVEAPAAPPQVERPPGHVHVLP